MINIIRVIQNKITSIGGSKEEFPLEHRILNLYIAIMIPVCAFFIFLVIIAGISWLQNIFLLIALIIHLIFFYFTRIKKLYKQVAIGSIIMWFILLPFIFISNAGIDGGSAYAMGLLLVYICAVTQGKTRSLLLIICFLEIIGLYFLNFFSPQIFLGYATETGRFIDIFISTLLQNALCCAVVIIMKNAYNDARNESQYLLGKERIASEKNEYFVKVFAHDIKNRLSTGIPTLELCKMEPQKNYIDEVISNEQEMNRMVLNLINIFSEEKLTLHKQRIEISSLINTLNEHWGSIFKSRNINYTCSAGNVQYIWVDHDYMQLVWDNLLSNASQHTPKDGKATVECTKDDNFVYIAFSNSGKLIPEESQKNLFSQYLSPEKQTVYHKGLGLNYSKMMCKLHGGDLTCSVENNMNKFTVKLPLENNDILTTRST